MKNRRVHLVLLFSFWTLALSIMLLIPYAPNKTSINPAQELWALSENQDSQLGQLHTTSGITETIFLPFVTRPAQVGSFLGKIAFAIYENGNSEIFIMNADGSGLVQITNSLEFESSPEWSPDNSRILFGTYHDTHRDIYVMNADGSNIIQLTNNPVNTIQTSKDWSPDGNKIVYSNDSNGNYELYIVNADGSGITNITNHPAEDFMARWSPDGTKIAFGSTRTGSPVNIYLINADGSNPSTLSVSDQSDDQNLTWSPDGSKIAFNQLRSPSEEAIMIMNSDGSNHQELFVSENIRSLAKWSPDGKQIAICALADGSQEGEEQIFLINFGQTAGKFQVVNTQANCEGSPLWSPDGTQILYSKAPNADEFALFIMNADGSGQQKILQGFGDTRGVDWSN
jgi:TolB protein